MSTQRTLPGLELESALVPAQSHRDAVCSESAVMVRRLIVAVGLLAVIPSSPAALGQATWRANVDSFGAEGYGYENYQPWYALSLAADGRFVAFTALMADLVRDDRNGRMDVFVHDRQTGETTRVSVDSSGNEGNSHSYRPSLSADGRFVAFDSYADNLVGNDTNGRNDVFVHDRQTGETTRVSVDSSGNEGNSHSYSPSLSADGRFVAFDSYADNLVGNDTNGRIDVFVHDRLTRETTRVSVSSSGEQGNGHSHEPAISMGGRFVTFYSSASNLVRNDTNGRSDVFVHDRQTGETARVSVDSAGRQGNLGSGRTSISADGRYVAFESSSTNLVTGDTNSVGDIFVHDRQTGKVTRVMVDSFGAQAVGGRDTGAFPAISRDGRFVTYLSDATNLVLLDTNDSWDVFVHGPELTLDMDTIPGPIWTRATFTTWKGRPGDAVFLELLAINGKPVETVVDSGFFGADGLWTTSVDGPSGTTRYTYRATGITPTNRTGETNTVEVFMR